MHLTDVLNRAYTYYAAIAECVSALAKDRGLPDVTIMAVPHLPLVRGTGSVKDGDVIANTWQVFPPEREPRGNQVARDGTETALAAATPEGQEPPVERLVSSVVDDAGNALTAWVTFVSPLTFDTMTNAVNEVRRSSLDIALDIAEAYTVAAANAGTRSTSRRSEAFKGLARSMGFLPTGESWSTLAVTDDLRNSLKHRIHETAELPEYPPVSFDFLRFAGKAMTVEQIKRVSYACPKAIGEGAACEAPVVPLTREASTRIVLQCKEHKLDYIIDEAKLSKRVATVNAVVERILKMASSETAKKHGGDRRSKVAKARKAAKAGAAPVAEEAVGG